MNSSGDESKLERRLGEELDCRDSAERRAYKALEKYKATRSEGLPDSEDDALIWTRVFEARFGSESERRAQSSSDWSSGAAKGSSLQAIGGGGGGKVGPFSWEPDVHPWASIGWLRSSCASEKITWLRSSGDEERDAKSGAKSPIRSELSAVDSPIKLSIHSSASKSFPSGRRKAPCSIGNGGGRNPSAGSVWNESEKGASTKGIPGELPKVAGRRDSNRTSDSAGAAAAGAAAAAAAAALPPPAAVAAASAGSLAARWPSDYRYLRCTSTPLPFPRPPKQDPRLN